MALPYENSTAGSDKAVAEIQKILRSFGCQKFGQWTDDAEQTAAIQFEFHGRTVLVKASAKGYAMAWLKEHPYTYRTKGTLEQHQRRAVAIGNVAIWSMLRDWIKGQLTAVATGMLSFEGAFLGQLMLPNGQTVLERVTQTNLLTAPE